MNTSNVRDVLVLGLGDSGLAMARWCARRGDRVRVWDSRAEPPQAATLAAEWPGVERLGGGLDLAVLDEVTLILKSPGLAPGDARIAPLLAAAHARGTAVCGELDVFAAALTDLLAQHGYAPRLLAVTGTNGKTTTTAMTALLVERAGQRVVSAGNIGPTLLDTLAAVLTQPQTEWPQVWVLELSSFQLDGGGHGVQGFEPAAACVLNIAEDHLDWHGDMTAYAAAKARVFGGSGTLVINRDDARVEAMVPAPPPAKGRAKAAEPARRVVRFGVDAPTHPGDFGLVVDNGMVWLARAQPLDDAAKPRKDEAVELVIQRLMPADALRVRGRHNAANALAALALATAIDCPLAPMLHGLREYRGEPHRVTPVGTLGGVEAYDDSKGTNVGATLAALAGLGADLAPRKLCLILGGDGKGQDFDPLAAPVARGCRAVALIGRDADRIASSLAATGVPMQRHATLEDATAWALAQAEPGDALLLSPACSSLDMFRNYGHRAEVFVAALHRLAAERGELIA